MSDSRRHSQYSSISYDDNEDPSNPSYQTSTTSSSANVSRRLKPQKLRPQSMIVINERLKDVEQAKHKLQQQQDQTKSSRSFRHDTEVGDLGEGIDDLDLDSTFSEMKDIVSNFNKPPSSGLSSATSTLSRNYLTTSLVGNKPRLVPTVERIKAAIKLVKSNIHTHQPSAHSLLWAEDRLILDLGSLYLKYGFSKDPLPQFVKPTYNTNFKNNLNYVEKHLGYYSLELNDLIQELGGEFMLEDKLFSIASEMFRTHLGLSPSRRRIVILENPYLPIKLKQLWCKVLFQRFQVSAVTFLSTHLAALLSCGESMGLVVDVGNLETSAVAIYDGRPLFTLAVTSPLAGKALTIHLKKLLLAYATVKDAEVDAQSDLVLIPAMLDLQVLERIKRTLLVVSSTRLDEPISLADPDLDERLAASATATDVDLPLNYKGRKLLLKVPGWVREHAYDVLFDSSQAPDLLTPPLVALECLNRIPKDLRHALMTRILVVGGTSATPNFHYRFQIEMLAALTTHLGGDKKLDRYRDLRLLSGKIDLIRSSTTQLFQSGLEAWVGASVACNIRGIEEQVLQDSFEQSLGVEIPDWSIPTL